MLYFKRGRKRVHMEEKRESGYKHAYVYGEKYQGDIVVAL